MMTIPQQAAAATQRGGSTADGGATPNGTPSQPSRKRSNRIVDWFLVRNELTQAQADAALLTAEQREYLRRATVARELGELALAPGNAVRSGPTAPLAANLFRQAVYWALLAESNPPEPISPEQLWATTERSSLLTLAGNESEFAYFSVAMRSTFIELAAGTEDAQRASAVLWQRAARSSVMSAQRVLWRVGWLKAKRAARLLLIALPAIVALVWLWPKKVDLAAGATWRTSSSPLECHPEKSECGGVRTNIFFHTNNEQNPWLEYDFGAPVAFSSLTIKNRSDYGPERAVPLVVEVSNDDKSFNPIARVDEPFMTWAPRFARQRARYLRLRVARESMLHLESVKVHP